jgi:hypothetical protein
VFISLNVESYEVSCQNSTVLSAQSSLGTTDSRYRIINNKHYCFVQGVLIACDNFQVKRVECKEQRSCRLSVVNAI